MLRYGFVETSLGRLLLVVSPRGLRALRYLDGEEDVLVAKMAARSNEPMVEDERLAEEWRDRLEAGFGGHPVDTLLDLVGTPFQLAVWRALCAIPAGQSRTYSEIAAAVGSPRAVRAVGQACGDNPVAVLVPCHRVLRKGGSLGGYYWGLDKKRELLQREGAAL